MKIFAIVDDVLNIRIAEFLAMDVERYYYRAYLDWKLDVQCPDHWDYIATRKYCFCKARGLNPYRFHVEEI